MDIVIVYGGLFFIGGFIGWVIELLFRRFVSARRWVNPGFLTGPILPIYGFGLICFYFFANVIPWRGLSPYEWLDYLLEVLAIGAALTLIEYIGGLIFIKGLKVKLWDYSERLGNIQGIICPLFSLIWTALGAFYVFVLDPAFVTLSSWMLAHELPVGMAVAFAGGILAVDFGWSIGLVARIRQTVADAHFVVSWDRIKESFSDQLTKAKERSSWLFAFATKRNEWPSLFAGYMKTAREEATTRFERERKKREEKLRRRLERKQGRGQGE